MNEEDLQAVVDRANPGDSLELLPREYKGPIVLSCPLVLDGRGATIWATRGPVVSVKSPGVVLKDLHIEYTGERGTGAAEQELALAADAVLDIRGVVVRGSVAGLPQEEGQWRYPFTIPIGDLPCGVECDLILRLAVPVDCRLVSKISGLEVEPQTLKPGAHEVRLKLEQMRADILLVGNLEIRSSRLTRNITVTGRIVEAKGKRAKPRPVVRVVWEPTDWHSLVAPIPPTPVARPAAVPELQLTLPDLLSTPTSASVADPAQAASTPPPPQPDPSAAPLVPESHNEARTDAAPDPAELAVCDSVSGPQEAIAVSEGAPKPWVEPSASGSDPNGSGAARPKEKAVDSGPEPQVGGVQESQVPSAGSVSHPAPTPGAPAPPEPPSPSPPAEGPVQVAPPATSVPSSPAAQAPPRLVRGDALGAAFLQCKPAVAPSLPPPVPPIAASPPFGAFGEGSELAKPERQGATNNLRHAVPVSPFFAQDHPPTAARGQSTDRSSTDSQDARLGPGSGSAPPEREWSVRPPVPVSKLFRVDGAAPAEPDTGKHDHPVVQRGLARGAGHALFGSPFAPRVDQGIPAEPGSEQSPPQESINGTSHNGRKSRPSLSNIFLTGVGDDSQP